LFLRLVTVICFLGQPGRDMFLMVSSLASPRQPSVALSTKAPKLRTYLSYSLHSLSTTLCCGCPLYTAATTPTRHQEPRAQAAPSSVPS
jgi:hypothetical protein